MQIACYNSGVAYYIPHAGMAELVDALDSKSSVGDNVPVRFRLPAPALWSTPQALATTLPSIISVKFKDPFTRLVLPYFLCYFSANL